MYSQIIDRLRRAAGTLTRGTAALGLAGLLALGAMTSNDAEARRVGGGQSLGRQSQSATPNGAAQRSQQAQPAQQAAQAPGAAAPRNRWMGPLAGLAAGLGIAALLSSFGLGEGLAQMLSNAMLIGLVVFAGVLLFRFIANRRRPDLAYGHGATNRSQQGGSPFSNRPLQQQQAERTATARDGSGNASGFRGWASGAASAAGAANTAQLGAGVDQERFLASSRAMFLRLQNAWDRSDQGDLFELTTPEMFARLKQDLESRGSAPSQTEVTQLEAEVLGSEVQGSETLVSVRFHGRMREDDAPMAEPFEEVWNLVRPTHGDMPWQLAGIQQIAS